MAKQYFEESLAHLKDAKGMGKAKFLSIQDDYCHFLQVTGQKEVSELGPQLTIYMGDAVDIQASMKHLLFAGNGPGSMGRGINKARWPLLGGSHTLALGKQKSL